MRFKINTIIFIVSSLAFLFGCNNDSKNPVKSETADDKKPSLSVEMLEKQKLDSLIKTNPDNPELFFERSEWNFNYGAKHAALADIYSAIHLDSLNIKYYYFGGELFVELGDGNKAVQLMSKAISLLPEDETLYLMAAEYNLYMGYHQSAINFINDLLRINASNAEAYFLKGYIYKDLNDIDKAISNFQTAVEQNPLHYDAYMQLGLLFSNKKNDLALNYFDNALRINENSREAIYGKAYHYQIKNNFNKAIENYKKILELHPKDSEIFFNIGFCYKEMDSLEKAFQNLNIATNIKPSYAGAHYIKGTIAESSGDNEIALKCYKTAQNMLPNDENINAAVSRLEKKVNKP